MNFKSILIALLASVILPCLPGSQSPAKASPGAILLATTTSFDNTGLLGYLLPIFMAQTGIGVDVVAVGTGAALELARNGDADIVLAHDREAEEAFIAEGHGLARHYIAQNEFVIIGPESDPADIKSAETAVDAFTRIMETKSRFVSRGDNSGTNMRELSIWASAGLEPEGEWYVEAGQGMGEVLNMANNKAAYALTDRGTYLAHQAKASLKIMVEGDPILLNPYSVIIPSPEKFPKMNLKGAERFADFLLSESTQKMIAEFGKDKYGQPLFYTYPKK